jgi:hypothetical protein
MHHYAVGLPTASNRLSVHGDVILRAAESPTKQTSLLQNNDLDFMRIESHKHRSDHVL